MLLLEIGHLAALNTMANWSKNTLKSQDILRYPWH